MRIAKVQKWGNSQGLRISREVLELADLAVGDELEVQVADREIVLKKVGRPKYDLAELVSRIPEGYAAREVSFGPPVGKEEW